jgi:hypothetical protein
MCQKIDRSFFTRLFKMEPADVCRRSLAEYDTDRMLYRIVAFGETFEVSPAAGDIKPARDPSSAGRAEEPVSVELGLLILFYLLGAREVPLSGKWVNEFSLRGGALFFRGPHAIRNSEISDRFGMDDEGFRKVCTKLGARPVQMGDAAYRFQVLPRIPVVVVLWYGDEEFEASAKLLMDSTIDSHLPLDVIYAMAVELVNLLMATQEGQ